MRTVWNTVNPYVGTPHTPKKQFTRRNEMLHLFIYSHRCLKICFLYLAPSIPKLFNGSRLGPMASPVRQAASKVVSSGSHIGDLRARIFQAHNSTLARSVTSGHQLRHPMMWLPWNWLGLAQDYIYPPVIKHDDGNHETSKFSIMEELQCEGVTKWFSYMVPSFPHLYIYRWFPL